MRERETAEALQVEAGGAGVTGAGVAAGSAVFASQPATPPRPGFDAIFGLSSDAGSHPAAPAAPLRPATVAASHPVPEAPSLRRRSAAADPTPFTPFTEAEHADRPVGPSSASAVSADARASSNAFDALFAGLDDDVDGESERAEPSGERAGRARRSERGGRPSRADRKAEKSQKDSKGAKASKSAKSAAKSARSAPAGPRRSGPAAPVVPTSVGDDLAFLLGTSAAASGAAPSASATAADASARFASMIGAAAVPQPTPAPSAPPVQAPAPLNFDAPVRRDAASDVFGLSATDATLRRVDAEHALRATVAPTALPVPPLPTEATAAIAPTEATTPTPLTRRSDALRTSRSSRDDRRGQESAGEVPRQRAVPPRLQAAPRPASRPAASAPSRRRRGAGRIASVVAMSFVALLAVATTIPSLSLLSAADVQALALSSAGGAGLDGQRVEVTGDVVAQSVQREGYESQTIDEYARAAGIRPEATFTNNPAGTIQWPFAVGVHIGDRFGYRSCAGCSSNHGGQDFNPGLGAEIQAIADGTVAVSTDSGGSLGVVMMIDHMIDGELITSVYAHMEYDSRRFEVGDTVYVGDVIGTTGDTGMSTGPHLHFEIRVGGVDGTKIDPLEWLYANTN